MIKIVAALLLLTTTAQADVDVMLVDVDSPQSWWIVNDGVMGGRSSSNLALRGDHYRFSGFLSLENNGGFASVRSRAANDDLSGYKGVMLRVKGDGRTYKLRFRTSQRTDGVAYEAEFGTRPEEWVEVALPFTAFRPVWRGRIVRTAGPLDASQLRQIGLMIADGRQGKFTLDVAWVRAFRKD